MLISMLGPRFRHRFHVILQLVLHVSFHVFIPICSQVGKKMSAIGEVREAGSGAVVAGLSHLV